MAKKEDTRQLDLFRDVRRFASRPPRRGWWEDEEKCLHLPHIGHSFSEASRLKMSLSAVGIHAKEKNGRWKGGEVTLQCKHCEQDFSVKRYRVGQVKYCSRACLKADPDKKSKLHKRIRASKEYSDWRWQVFRRDDFTCQECGRRGKGLTLQADHIKPFALFPELRFDVSNGRTLCIDCHSKTDTFGVHTWRRKAYLLSRAEAEAQKEPPDEL